MQSPDYVTGSTSDSAATHVGEKSSVCSGLPRNCRKNVMDGRSATIWHCNQAGPCFLKFDLERPTSVTGFKVLTFEKRMTSAALQGSADGNCWTNVAAITVPSPSPAAPTVVSFDAHVYRYWKLASIVTGDSRAGHPAIKEAWFRKGLCFLCTDRCARHQKLAVHADLILSRGHATPQASYLSSTTSPLSHPSRLALYLF